MKKINHLISALIMAAMTAGFASCSSSDEPSSESDNTPKELTITIKTQGVKTKAAETSDPTPTKENTMNRITIGIFDQSGNTVRAIQEFAASSDPSNVGAGKYFFNQTNNSATFTVVTTKMELNDKILVAVNAPAKYFAGVSTAADFRDKQLSADQALYRDATDQILTSGSAVNNNIPMFGEASPTAPGSNGTTYEANITVKHLTAKVTLDELKVDFAADGPYSNATFTPTEIFMYNVPDGVKFNTSDQCSSTTFLTGASTSSTNKKDYLSSGAFSGSALSGDNTTTSTNTFGTDYFFYVTPNKEIGDNKMKLVIKGKFDADGSGTSATEQEVYYPVKLNYNVNADGSAAAPSGGNAFVVSPNKNYKCKVTIKTIGSTGPGDDIDPTTAEISITVANFEEVDQTTVFQ